jgi:hypothetical protein
MAEASVAVIHSAPSGPAAIIAGFAFLAPATAIGYSVTTPPRVMRPTLFALRSVNHSAPSLPVAMPLSPPAAVVTGANSVTAPVAGAILPMRLPLRSVK